MAHPGHEPGQQIIRTADEDTANFIESLVQAADPFFLVITGDHGPRITNDGEFAGDESWGQEHKIPALIFVTNLDDPDLLKHLSLNQNRLSTKFDMYATLLDIGTRYSLMENDNILAYVLQ